MEDLQDALQSILSDPEQMARVAALAESLGLKPPDAAAAGTNANSAESPAGARREPQTAVPGATSHSNEDSLPGEEGFSLANVMGLLSASSGGETKLLSALRAALDPEGQTRVDRALRAAKLSRLAGTLLAQRRG